jgi:uncharacterized protein (DUF1015 family)
MGLTQPPVALLPFHGLRFRSGLPGGLSAVIGPPADIESDDSARAFVRERPHSAVQLEVSDEPGELSFSGARDLLTRWRRSGVLRIDREPGYYYYEQEFTLHGVRHVRRGLFGLVPLDAPNVLVLPHEGTWEDNRDRRLQLLRALDASLSPLFLLYEPRDSALPDLLARLSAGPPHVSDSDDFGETHRLWHISDPATVAEIARRMAGQPFVIADGHHRFEAAQLYHAEQRRPETGVVLALSVATTDPGTLLLPFHRLLRVRSELDWATLLATLERWFQVYVQSVGAREGAQLVAELGTDELPTIGLIGPGGVDYALLTLRSWDLLEHLVSPDLPGPVRRLDVVAATELVIDRALDGVPAPQIDFTNDPDEALAAVRAHHARLALLLRPARLEQVLDVARAHGRMPPKTTSFVPKVPIGLVMHDFQAERDR